MRPSRTGAWATAIGAVVLAVFLPALRNGFVEVDDGSYVTQNLHVLRGLSINTLAWAFRTGETGTWHPLTWISHLLDVSVFGLRPWGHHLTSVVLHALTSALAFLALERATGERGRSAIASLLFGLHPLRVESVAWVAERKDVLCALFYVAALLQYTRYRERETLRRYGGVLLLSAAAMLAKPMAVTLPFALLLWDFWPLGSKGDVPDWGRRLREKVPLVALAAVTSWMTVHFQRGAGAVVEALTWSDRIRFVPLAYAKALQLTFWPFGLSIQYLRADRPWSWSVASALVVALLILATVAIREKRPMLLFGLGWFLVTLAPTTGIVPVGAQLTADRYTYLPHLGLFAALVFAWRAPASVAWQRVQRGVAAVALAAVVTLTLRQIPIWRDSESLFQNALRVDPLNDWVRLSVGLLRLRQGRLQEARREIEASLALRPGVPFAVGYLAEVLLRLGQPDRAFALAQQAKRAAPADAWVQISHAHVLVAAGRYDEAIAELQQVHERNPQLLVERDLTKALGIAGRTEDALVEAYRGLSRAPDDPELLFDVGITLARAGRLREAQDVVAHLLSVAPDYPHARELASNVDQDLRRSQGLPGVQTR